ncbi:hypothetical protein E2F50_01425 [Rhizobium deserti]|uniref:Uncharacterized protein n=1 Tax=Rhizobium deserti TaxID=2547961 RepID=A0A4R5ULY5_9HYPH|nr:hypothetical protein [Rhizobium deserti]TDK38833.1 hypothetical protein E2F50_01425 [Rhizobium deserti]
MALRLIEGGRVDAASTAADHYLPGRLSNCIPDKSDVRREAERRLQVVGYPKWHDRQAATGISMPREIKYLAMQIGYVAEALSALSTIPLDFRSDIYWPASEAAAWGPAIRRGP